MDAVQYKKLSKFIEKSLDTAYGARAIREGWDGALIQYIKGAAQEDILQKRNIVVPIYAELLDKIKKGF